MANDAVTARARYQSLRDRARNAAAGDPAYSAHERIRFFAFSRFLARVFTAQPDDWALKGAGALLARLPTARASNDLDLLTRSALDQAETRLQQVAATHLDDGVTFTVIPRGRPITGNSRGLRFTVDTRTGPYRFATFRADVVVDWTNTQPIETVPAATPIPLALPAGPPWRVYPVADHLADKVCATYEHIDPARSTRFHDLVDIALIACNLPVSAGPLATSLANESRRRAITLPRAFVPPDWSMWQKGFSRLRREAGPLGARWPAYEDAISIAQALLNPVLSGQRHRGEWDPRTRHWADQDRSAQ